MSDRTGETESGKSVVITSGNDAVNGDIARANCAFCAIGGLVGKSANDIMRDVEAMSGSIRCATDRSDLFARFYVARKPSVAWDDGQTLQNQVAGIKLYLELKGLHVDMLGTVSVEGFFERDELIREANRLDDGTRFLVLTGKGVEISPGMYGAHWTVGQKQGSTARFFDYQMRITDGSVRSFVEGKENCAGLSQQGDTDYPVLAWGQKLDDDDKGLLLIVKTRH